VGLLEKKIEFLEAKDELLEKKVRELEEGLQSEYVQRVKLEAETKMLRAQLSQQALPEDRVLSGSNWVPAPAEGLPVSTYPVSNQIYTPALQYDDAEASQHLYSVTADPMWNVPMGFDQPSQSLIKPATPWGPFQMPMSPPSRYDFDILNTPVYVNTTCWQSQPSTAIWQSGTRLKAPVAPIDHLLMSVIESQRLLVSADGTGQLLGRSIPAVHALIGHPSPARLPPTLAKIMARYAAVLSNRGFASIPERLASFVAMYGFVRWQISPTAATYNALHDWQRPQPSQFDVPHPAWMDFPPWPKFRDRIIGDQARYDNAEFHHDYVTNLSVNFPHNPMDSVVVLNGQIKVSEIMERHVGNSRNASMRRPFAEKYPELRDVCRFEEV
jgi:hypothetical protein